MAASATSERERVRTLNDLLRRHRIGGQGVLTSGVLALGLGLLMLIDDAVSRFDAFTPDNDPYGEHDFGLVRVQGHVVLFKIDAYDLPSGVGAERIDGMQDNASLYKTAGGGGAATRVRSCSN